MDFREITKLAEKVISGGRVERAEALELCSANTDITDLLYHAKAVRRFFFGNIVSGCAIVSLKTGGCSEDCRYCAQSAYYGTKTDIHGFLDREEVFRAALEAKRSGAGAIGVVTSGRGITSQTAAEKICVAIRAAAEAGIEPHASVGIVKSGAVIEAMKSAGLTCAHHNLETSEKYFSRICTTHTWAERYETLLAFKQHGLKLCSGGLFGLGETWEDRVELALALRELQPDSVPLNFLYPVSGTPLEYAEPMTPLECLRIIAVFRFILSAVPISVCGGREYNLRDLQSRAFDAGATGLMIGNYLTTTGRNVEDDMRMVADAGYDYVAAGCLVSSRAKKKKALTPSLGQTVS